MPRRDRGEPPGSDQKGGIILDADYRLEESAVIKIFATTAYVEHPTDHQMLRSTLDPSYGKSSKHHPDGQ